MNLLAQLRIIVLLRRAVRALESLAASHRTLAESIREREVRARERTARRKHPRPTEIGTMDVAAVEELYQARRKAEELDRG